MSEWITLLEEKDLKGYEPGEIISLELETDDGLALPIALVHDPSAEHSWIAFQNVCTHDGAGMEEGYIDLKECSIECPRHGAQFNMKTGKVMSMPAAQDIKTFLVRLDNENLQVQLP